MLHKVSKISPTLFVLAVIVIFAVLISVFPLQKFSLSQENNSKIRKPHITPKENFYNFGAINQGKKIEYDLILKNTDKSPYVIKQLITDLGLEISLPESRVIKPNEPYKLNLSFNSASFEGKITKKLKIITSEPNVKPILFEIKGNILPEIGIEPEFINFEKSERNTQKELKVSINGIFQPEELEISIPSAKIINISRTNEKNNIHLLLSIMQNKGGVSDNKKGKECLAQRLVISYPDRDAKKVEEKKHRVIPIYIDCDKKFIKNS